MEKRKEELESTLVVSRVVKVVNKMNSRAIDRECE
jgi:hypothetical protein